MIELINSKFEFQQWKSLKNELLNPSRYPIATESENFKFKFSAIFHPVTSCNLQRGSGLLSNTQPWVFRKPFSVGTPNLSFSEIPKPD